MDELEKYKKIALLVTALSIATLVVSLVALVLVMKSSIDPAATHLRSQLECPRAICSADLKKPWAPDFS